MAEQMTDREPRRDPGEPLPEQAPGAGRRRPVGEERTPEPVEVEGRVEGSSEDFVPRTTTDVAQHAPGPHGQGDEPSSAPAGRHDYDDTPVPDVRATPRPDR
jgi:hypothetical protein